MNDDKIKEIASQFFIYENGELLSPVDGYTDITEEIIGVVKKVIEEIENERR